MRSSSSLLSAPPSPHPAPLPLSSPSSLTHCPELDLSVTLSPAPKTGLTQPKPRPLKKSQQSDQSQPKPRPRQQRGRKGNTQVCFEEPVVVTVTSEPQITLNRDSPPQQPIRGQRRSRGRHHGPRPRVEAPAAASNQDPGCLQRAELNTTLALKAELELLQGAEFNSQKAIQETLQKSERTKNLINTRATEVVNVARSQHLFTSLVSIDMQEDQLISQLLQDRMLLAPTPRCHGNKAADGPNLLHFMTPDLVRQKPLPPEEETANYKPCPCTHPAYSTFDLYRRRRRWEATP
ncbi:protein phosphatase 1 regulatory subunit 35 isoform X2 [Micropterus salmoides]|uniref:protein phosphatase 1 regulatory subunit 35 isoform X2 n=1 Tax=Micropterus salmoides TaxID=27706 RepID=UPI0018EAD096|nr:protein phosphatase 1 regulatory subunit 35 isoform X2 [Micropterus salmoides]